MIQDNSCLSAKKSVQVASSLTACVGLPVQPDENVDARVLLPFISIVFRDKTWVV